MPSSVPSNNDFFVAKKKLRRLIKMNAGGVKNKRRRETRKVKADRNRYKHLTLKVPNVEFDVSVTVDSANAALVFDINAVIVL